MGQPQDRQWTVDLRARAEDGSMVYDEDYARQATAEAYLDLATIQHREGGGFVVAPIRRQIEPPADSLTEGPVWVNLGLMVEHKFVPPVTPRGEVDGLIAAQDAQNRENRAAIDASLAEGAAVFAEEDRAMVEAEEPAAVMAQPADPGDVRTAAPLDPSKLIPEVR